MKKILEKYPLFLLTLPSFVVIHLEKGLHHLIRMSLSMIGSLFCLSVPLIILGIWYLFLRSVSKASLMTLSCLLPFYYTGDLKSWLSGKFPHSFLQSYSFLLSVFVVMVLVLLFILKRKRTVPGKLFFFINTAIFLFIAADVVTIFFTGSKNKYTIDGKNELSYRACDSCYKPDIYYIIFDAYTSSNQLKNEYGYSNQAIEDYLHNKGFYIAQESKSNYCYTAYSVGSTLNMNYITNVDTINKTTDRTYLQALKLVYKNKLVAFLQNQDYKVLNHSLFDIGSYPTTIKHVDFWGIRELFDQYNLFLKLYYDAGYHLPSRVKKLFNNKYFVNDVELRKDLPDTVFRHLLQSVKMKTKQPRFVYAHFLQTHPPYFFDSTGKKLPKTSDAAEGYIHQVAYSNRLIKQIADSIIAISERPAIIILQGDHGISFKDPVDPPDKFPILNAIFFSNKDYRLLADSTTSVNTFRIILNTFFEQDLRQLPNKYYHLW
jgi:hypothetical protein